ncbi:MAG TPA: phosphatidate cytidylyltransferase [Gammaproteobacteria bacterium]|nr:phosphatidate cytidylyltransferase [Gammaproteobacteria bacterium]
MLRNRVITALLLALLSLWVVWLAPAPVFLVFFIIVGLLASAEWARLCGYRGLGFVSGYAVVVAIGQALGWWYLVEGGHAGPLLACVALWWAFAVFWLMAFAGGRTRPLPGPLLALVGLLVLGGAWLGVVSLFLQAGQGAYWVTVLFILVWGSDIGGYFVGRALGRHKLAPKISPGKTWEGAGGGLVLGLGVAFAFHAALHASGVAVPSDIGALPGLLGGAFVIALGIAGDLFESMIKRQHGVKDSGSVLPGHGGVLDRIDALLAAAPILALVVLKGGL